ncbi:hypothetical protein NVS89_07300 [Ancylobacter sp. MQZ15Z-1]|uniref:Uncharacterized protein n=1 Tax=Ancylobacter mangrovi TaxID=2972472 RepID=A0A9X2PCH0_9HYPH|nr:hypothetical protein [Ancylobacter mangrovi]MCS0494899.1 hypothetical protein [Ancylobacter mangrovi]
MKPFLTTLAALVMLGTAPAFADCAQEMTKTQAALDKLIEKLAAKGPEAPESSGALLNQDPSPMGLAKTEAKIGDGLQPEDAQKALDRAHAAAAAGDEATCLKEVSAAKAAIAQN